jgi:hypothetical protein
MKTGLFGYEYRNLSSTVRRGDPVALMYAARATTTPHAKRTNAPRVTTVLMTVVLSWVGRPNRQFPKAAPATHATVATNRMTV